MQLNVELQLQLTGTILENRSIAVETHAMHLVYFYRRSTYSFNVKRRNLEHPLSGRLNSTKLSTSEGVLV